MPIEITPGSDLSHFYQDICDVKIEDIGGKRQVVILHSSSDLYDPIVNIAATVENIFATVQNQKIPLDQPVKSAINYILGGVRRIAANLEPATQKHLQMILEKTLM